jgi:16S rRNA (cytidine1402-2'-O)-methyltransferase
LPHKKGRQTKLQAVAAYPYTTILYESPFRLLKTLQQLAEVCSGERKVCVSRELTKIHEENARGTLAEVIEHFSKKDIKGEIVIVLEGTTAPSTQEEQEEE